MRTPNRFPGILEAEDGILVYSGSTSPTINGEIRYVTGKGFEFKQEGIIEYLVDKEVLSNLTSSLSASYILASANTNLSASRLMSNGLGTIVRDLGSGSTIHIDINDNVVATLSGSTFSGTTKFNQGLSGSLTKLIDGTSYLKAGSNILISSESNGSITVSLSGNISSDHNLLTGLQGGTTSQYYHLTSTEYSKIQNLSSSYADENVSYVVLNTTASLPNERVLAVGSGLKLLDSGPGSTIAVLIDNNILATISGSTFSGPVNFSGGLSGSLTQLTDGTSYLKAGANVSIISSSNGSVTITASTGSTSDHGHNQLNGIQGGTTNQYYHLTSTEYSKIQNLDSYYSDKEASYVVLNTTSSLPNERSLSSGVGIKLVDGGAGSNVSLSINDNIVATLSGSTFTGTVNFSNGLSGSLTQLTDGTSYLKAGSNINITSASNGSITISLSGNIVTDHNTLSNLQGGSSNQYYHLTSTEYSKVQNLSSSYADINSSYIVLNTTSSLPNERVLTTGIGINVSDSGPGSNVSLSIQDNIVATISGSTFSGAVNFSKGLSGSLTTLTDGTSYLKAGSNISITSASNGSITIQASTGSTSDHNHNSLSGIQGGTTNQYYHLTSTEYSKVQNLSSSYADINASYIVLNTTSSLPNERVLTSGTGINITDSGPGSNVSLSINNNVVATISGSTFSGAVNFSGGLSGSLTTLTDGTSYLKAGTNITITSASNGSVIIQSSTGSTSDHNHNSLSGLQGGTTNQYYHLNSSEYSKVQYLSSSYADINSSYIVLNTTASLPNERVLTAGTGIRLTDSGAGSSLTTSINDNIVATISGSTFTGAVRFNQGLSGSLTQLTDGTSYLRAGANISITSSSNGSVTITASTGSASDYGHNLLNSIQGGTTNQYYHLTANEYNQLQSIGYINEPMGFSTRSDSEILYNSGSRILTIQPKSPATSFNVFVNGLRHNITSSLSVTHDTAPGSYYCYFNTSGSFVVSPVNTPWDIATSAQVALVSYNSTNNPVGFHMEERHGIVMSWADHMYAHTTRGTQYINGFPITGSTVATGPTSNANNQYRILSGTIADEDLVLSLSDSAAANYTLMYRSGSSGDWKWITDSVVPYFTGSTYIQYNQNNLGSWRLTELTNGQYCNYFVFATPSLNNKFNYVVIPGQNVYTSAGAAQSGESAISLSLGTLPFQEIVPLYEITFRAQSSYTSAFGRTRIELTPLKIVSQNLSIAITGGATSHSSLSNRSDANSHPATAISTSTSNFVGSSILTSSDTDVQLALESLGTKAAAISGSTFTGAVRFNQGLSGSLTTLTDGTSYLKAGDNITITSASNGSVTITASTGSTSDHGHNQLNGIQGGATNQYYHLTSTEYSKVQNLDSYYSDKEASYVVLNTTASLPNERSLAAGTGICLTDSGAGSNVSLSINDNVVATISGSTFSGVVRFSSGLSGSLTTLTDGTSYLKAGDNIEILSQSNGSIILSNSLKGFTQNYISSGGNTALGVSAFNASTSGLGTHNTAVGYKAGYNSPSTNYNCYYGAFAGWTSNGSNNNVAIGYQAMYNSVGATNFTVIGSQAAPYAQNSSNLVAIGYRAYQSAPYGVNLKTVVIGGQTAIGISGGDCIVAVGQYAGYNYSGGVCDSTGCTLLGADTGFRYNTIVNNSFAVGRGAVVATSSVGVLGSVDYPVKVGINMEAPTAFLELPSGSTTTAPFKLTSGSLITIPQSGSIEYDGNALYFTNKHGVRNQLSTGSAGGTTVYNGSINLDFGSYISGSTFTSASVTGQTGILNTSSIYAWMNADSTVDHNELEHAILPIKLSCGNITPGVGFTIYGMSDLRVSGLFKVRWTWN